MVLLMSRNEKCNNFFESNNSKRLSVGRRSRISMADSDYVEFSVAQGRKYTLEHLWLQVLDEKKDDSQVKIGLSEFVRAEYGDIVRVILTKPEDDSEFKMEESDGEEGEDSQDDDWTKFSATITGDIGFADLTFTTSALERDFEVLSDYSHYSVNGFVEGYYTCYTYYFGDCVDPSIQFENDTTQEVTTHELRIASKDNDKLNWILGTFYNESDLKYNSQWHVPTINPDAAVPTTKDLYYQTDQTRVDEETAHFGELYYLGDLGE